LRFCRYLEVPKECRLPSNDFESSVWITDEDSAFRLATALEERDGSILVGFRDENGFYEKRVVPKSEVQAPSISYFVEDMCNLSEPNDASVLNALRLRYEAQLIHKLPIYTKEVMDVYMNPIHKGCALPPHVYSVAQTAYSGLLSGNNQSILIT
uniref:Myosin motor domain-containing protein n=1 Tax=Gongylonema pulchrum TaxID=637853 RepID=A0A183D0Y5_9BILA